VTHFFIEDSGFVIIYGPMNMKQGGRSIESGSYSEENQENNLIYLDPTDLVRNNPAALIVSQEIYNRIRDNFSPDLFDPVQIVQVVVRSSDGGEDIRQLAADGIHRARVVADHKGESLPSGLGYYPGIIPARDATKVYLNMPWVVTESERNSNQTALTVIQYLRVVIPWTKEHAQIAPARIAAHLINGWNNIVGDPLAQKFSALAALNFLNNPEIPKADIEALKAYLSNQTELLNGISATDRNILQNALIDTASIIQGADLVNRSVAEAAFRLIGSDQNSIGGESQARSEVYGLLNGILHNPKTEQALVDSSGGNLVELEARRVKLEELLFNALSQPKTVNVEPLLEAIANPTLTIPEITSVLEAWQPQRVYKVLKTKSDIDRLRQAYKAAVSRDKITEAESKLIENLAFTYDPEKLEEYSETIEDATNTVSEARKLAAYISEQQSRPTLTPEQTEEWRNILLKLSRSQSGILSSRSLGDAGNETLTLKKYVSDIWQNIQLKDVNRLAKEKNTKEQKSINNVSVERGQGIHYQKKETPNDTLIEILGDLNFQLEFSQIKAEDLNKNTLVWIEKIINQLGELRFRTPNITEIIDKYLEKVGINWE
jgi:hypothetical protein